MDYDLTRYRGNVALSRHWLESLSTGELAQLTDDLGVDIPPGQERELIIEELLENYFKNVNDAEHDLEATPLFTETAALPKHYNISFIEVMIRDPLWVFVFWEIKGHDKEAHEKANNFNGYCLRVIPLNGEDSCYPSGSSPKTGGDSFTVAINQNDSARYIGFPEHTSKTADSFIIKLCAIRGAQEVPVAVSPPFNLPRLAEIEKLCSMESNPLVYLSGARDFLTIKNTDRHSRGKRQ